MDTEKPIPTAPCLCNALRQASRSVTRLYDDDLRALGLRTTQNSLLRHLDRAGEPRQRDLGERTSIDETTSTRNLAPLVKNGWVAVRPGDDRREDLVRITEAGRAKLEEAGPARERAQERIRSLLPEGAWQTLLAVLPDMARLMAEA
jgi:DNA-binding MarR family transcriptional regulator